MPTSVAMAHSMSHQNSVGTGSAGPSASASPNMTSGGKNSLKRRQSTHAGIKAEGTGDDVGGGAGLGNEKVKQSPSMRKKVKGGN